MRLRACIPAVLLWLLGAPGASLAASDVSGIVGMDYYRNGSEVTTGALGAAVLGFRSGGFATAAAVRYDDDRTGDGTALTAGVGAPIGGRTLIRAFGTRWIGEESFRAWRLKAGPFFEWAGGSTLGLSAVRHDAGDDGAFTGAMLEGSIPLSERWRGTLTGTAGTLGGGRGSVGGSAGVGWQAATALEILVEAGIAQEGALAASGTAPAGGGGPPGGLPLLGLGSGAESAGGASRGSTNGNTTGTLSVGIRVSVP